jgi:hypothetical protein
MVDQTKTYQEFKMSLSSLNDEEFIEKFNEQVGNQGWGTARAIYLGVIREEFQERNIDISEINHGNGISYQDKIELFGKKVTVSTNH